MKAVEWAAKFESVPASEAPAEERFAEVLKEFGAETAELVAARTKNSGPEPAKKFPAADGAVKEQRGKFRAICGRVPTLTDAMFDTLLATAVPDFAVWQKAATKKAEPKPEDDVKNYRQKRYGGKHHHKKEKQHVSNKGGQDQVRS